jgi:hypothetical protein
VAPSSILRTGSDSTRASNRIGWKDHADVQEFGGNKFFGASEAGINFWKLTISLPEVAGTKRAAESSLEGKAQKKRKTNPAEVVPAPAAPVQPIEQPEATAPVDDDFEELPPDVLEEMFAEAAAEIEEQVRRINEATAPAAPAVEQAIAETPEVAPAPTAPVLLKEILLPRLLSRSLSKPSSRSSLLSLSMPKNLMSESL